MIMKTTASLIAMSHLSDVQEVLSMNTKDVAIMNKDINFVKFLILELKGNLNKEIDADEIWNKFLNR